MGRSSKETFWMDCRTKAGFFSVGLIQLAVHFVGYDDDIERHLHCPP